MLKKIETYEIDNNMKINYKKTKLMLFNPGTARDFLPKFTVENKVIESVDETTLLGVVIRSDLSWSPNTNYITKRANKKLWCLKRLKRLGANREDLLDVYHKQIRSLLELSAPVWHCSLIGEDRLKIERVQKSAFSIILGEQYNSYNTALKLLHMETLFTRRNKLCEKFAWKSQKHEKFSKWFKPKMKNTATRENPTKFCKVVSRTERLRKTPISSFINFLNKQ